jgi:hypothetical protein
MRESGKWPHPLPVPQFDLECAGGRMIDLEDLRGRMLRIIAGSGDEQAEPDPPSGIDVATIFVMRERAVRPADACLASEPETWASLAIILGVSKNDLVGAQILVDQNAWLRAAWRPGGQGDWTNPQSFAATIRAIAAHPIGSDAIGGHAHRR